MSIQYASQASPRGIADAFVIGESFIGENSVALVLGDNIFYGHGLSDQLTRAAGRVESGGGAVVFGYYVDQPQRYGVVGFDGKGKVLSIEEKPKKPKSNFAVTGLYFYDNNVVGIAKSLKPSSRGELEITDVNKTYLQQGQLNVELLGRGFAWLDTGTYESLLESSEFIATLEKRQGLKVGCVEEIAYRLGYIDRAQLTKLSRDYSNNSYGEYLSKLLED